MFKLNEEIQKTFSEIYPSSSLPEQLKRYEGLSRAYGEHFGEAKVRFYSAPGRVEIGGNHTDHQRGKVLAVSVDLDIIAAISKQDDQKIRLRSQGIDREILVDINALMVLEGEKGTPEALIKGVLKYFQDKGYKTGGFCGCISSIVPEGSGLSSSAAFESLIGEVINREYNNGQVSKLEIAKAGKHAENVYFGKMSGLMDQMASAIGGFTYIDFKDNENPFYEKIDFDISKIGYALCVVNTGGSHASLSGEYSLIPFEMREIASHFGKETLADVDEISFFKSIPVLREKWGDRGVLRAIHFFNDTNRVERQKALIEKGDMKNFLKEITESGRSSFCYLQNVYVGSNYNEQGISLALALSEKVLGEKGAWRVHGGGFAGTILAVFPRELYEGYQEAMEEVFGEGACVMLNVRPYGVCFVG